MGRLGRRRSIRSWLALTATSAVTASGLAILGSATAFAQSPPPDQIFFAPAVASGLSGCGEVCVLGGEVVVGTLLETVGGRLPYSGIGGSCRGGSGRMMLMLSGCRK